MSGQPSQLLTPGTVVAQYEIECVLGQGAMGVVYLAIQDKLDRMVALKILKPALAADAEFVHRFFNEARSAASLSHPNIVQAYDAGFLDPDLYYFVMEYIRGETLHERVQREGALKPQDALAVARDLADALNHGWKRQSLVHGDIKPENVMIGQNGETKLADFGLAKVVEHDFSGEGVMLTPLYAAPELIQGTATKADCRSDIYSFGATLYHLLAGEPPFPGTDPKAVLNRHLTEVPKPLAERNPAVSKELSDFVCNQLLAKSPDKRPQNWEGVLSSIDRLQSQRSRKVVTRHLAVAGQPHPHSVSSPVSAAGHPAEGPASGTTDGSMRMLWMTLGMLLLLLCLLLGASALLPSGRAMWAKAMGRPCKPVVVEPELTPEQKAADEAWRQMKPEVLRESDPKVALVLLDGFRRDYPDWTPPDFQKTLREYQLKAGGSTKLPQAPVPSPSAPKPSAPKPVPAPKPAPATPKPAPTPPAPKPATPAPHQADADRAVLQADEFTAILAEADQALGAQPSNLEPVIQKCKAWLARYPEQSKERDLMLLLSERVIPGADEFLPKIISQQGRLAGLSLKVGTEMLPIREISLSELSFTRKTEYGEIVVKQAWSAVDRAAILMQLGTKLFGDAALPLAEKAPFLAYLMVSDQTAAAAQMIGALPDSPEKKTWIVLCSRFQQLPTETAALAAWEAARTAMKDKKYSAVDRQLQLLRAGGSQLAERHAAEIKRMGEECTLWVPELQASAMVRQAQAKLTDDPHEAMVLLNCVLARYGNTEFPEKKDLVRLREKAVSLLVQAGIRGVDTARIHHFVPCLEPVRQQYSGVSAVVYAMLSANADMPPAVSRGLPKLYPLVLLDMGDLGGARKLLDGGLASDAEGVPPRLQAAILLGQTLLAQRFETGDPSLAEQNRKLKAVADRVAAEPPPKPNPDDKRSPEEVRRHAELEKQRMQVMIGKAMLDGVHCSRSWNAEALWPSADKLAKLPAESGAGWLLMAELACELEQGRLTQAAAVMDGLAGDAGAGMEKKLVIPLADFLRGKSDKLPIPAVKLAPEVRECMGRLLVSAWAARFAALPADAAEEPAERLEAVVVAEGWLGGETWFDLLLMRTGLELRKKDYAAAADLLKAALEEKSPSTVACYPRLRLLQAGVSLVSGQSGSAGEYMAMVAASPSASPSELAAAASLNRSSSVGGGEAGRKFWTSWVEYASAMRSHDVDGALLAARQMEVGASSLAMKAFAKMAASAAAALEGASGKGL